MSCFKDMVIADNAKVFMNTEDFAEKRTVVYDGEVYMDIPIILKGLKQADRTQQSADHAEGLYSVTSVLHCKEADLGGKQPEKGTRIKVNDCEGGGGYFSEFYVASSVCELGMLRIELEAIDE